MAKPITIMHQILFFQQYLMLEYITEIYREMWMKYLVLKIISKVILSITDDIDSSILLFLRLFDFFFTQKHPTTENIIKIQFRISYRKGVSAHKHTEIRKQVYLFY